MMRWRRGPLRRSPDSLLYQAGIKNTRIVVENDTSKQIEALAAGQMQFVTTTGDHLPLISPS
jgi:ABC-type nitrate/sulfonate/bicarbonate transport system substrate-binding protein